MKAVVGCLAVIGLGIVVLIGLAFFLISNPEDQGDLTKQVDVTITKSEERRKSTGGHTIDYTYRVGDQQFVNETWIRNSGWMPGQVLRACVDPDDPAEHALRRIGTEDCGGDFVGYETDTAEPVP